MIQEILDKYWYKKPKYTEQSYLTPDRGVIFEILEIMIEQELQNQKMKIREAIAEGIIDKDGYSSFQAGASPEDYEIFGYNSAINEILNLPELN